MKQLHDQPQWQLLQNAFMQNRLSHAYLLSGMCDIGKTDFAKQFAAFLLCDKKTLCGQCRGCTLMRAETHPDFLFITPHEKTHSIKIDQIRELSEKLSRTAQCGGYQVVIISPADAMPVQAANALLKTLEEPTGKVIFFLIDHQQHYLPITIMSRCQKLFFHSDGKIKSFLEKDHVELRDQIIQHLDLLMKRKTNAITPAAQWQKNMETVLQLLLLICIDVSRIQQQVSPQHLLSVTHEKKLISIADKINPVALQEFMNIILEKLSFCSRGINLNQQLCLEDIFIVWEKKHDL